MAMMTMASNFKFPENDPDLKRLWDRLKEVTDRERERDRRKTVAEVEKQWLQQVQQTVLGEAMPAAQKPARKPPEKWKGVWLSRSAADEACDEYVENFGTLEEARSNAKACTCEGCEALLELIDERIELAMQRDAFTSPGIKYTYYDRGVKSFSITSETPVVLADLTERLLRLDRTGRKPTRIVMLNEVWLSIKNAPFLPYRGDEGRLFGVCVQVYSTFPIALGTAEPYFILDDRDERW